MDTIFALASARGKAGIAVFRLSGPAAHRAVLDLCGSMPMLRKASVRRLVWQSVFIDEAVVLLFEDGASFTGEAVAELHVHGSLAVIKTLTRVLSDMDGLRQAEPGEFTRRALENGRLDLTQVEGLADLIDAETEAQRRQAIVVLSGAIGKRAEVWRRSLIRSTALVEATIDFSEEDVPGDISAEVCALLDDVLQDLQRETDGATIAERLRDGFEVAIIGAPNSGKSTLLNALAGREAAITSEFAGTTRDVIEVHLDLRGMPVSLLDTAGLREATDPVEQMGIKRAIVRAEAADLRVFLKETEGEAFPVAVRDGDILLWCKADLFPGREPAVSGMTGVGIDRLIDGIVSVLADRLAAVGIMTRERHRTAMLQAIGAVESARAEVWKPNGRAELVAADLWRAIKALDMLVGRLDVEAMLDEIFASFCIGK